VKQLPQHIKVGAIGEDIACEFLRKKGLTVIERNFRRKWGELDIVAREKSGNIVFIEVKTIRQSGNSADSANSLQAFSWIRPEDNLTKSKLKKLQRTVSLYMGNYKSDAGWRIDLIAITIHGSISDNLTNIMKNCEIKHFEDIF